MLRFRQIYPLALLSAGLVLIGCSDRAPTGPEHGSVESTTVIASIVGPPPDVSGSWNWSNVERLRMPEFVAIGVGVVPEGKNTHARCESAGTLALTQSGAEFQGVAVKTFNACETHGGQPFQQPSATFLVEDGRIAGHTVRFSFESFTVQPCPHHAVIADVSGGVALELRGSGHCVLPGHPQSESPIELPPPPGGTSTTLSWVATR